MLAACSAQIPCRRKHQCRVAQRVIFHFLIPSTTHSWWPEDLELCAILHCLSLCTHPEAPFNPLHLFTLSPLTLPRYLFSSPFSFSLIVHPRAAKIQIPRSLYRAISLCLSFFSAFFSPPSFLLHRRSWSFVSRNRWLRPVSFLWISLIRFAAVNSKPIVEKPSTRRGISLNGDIVACFSTMFLTFDKENYENGQRYLFANVLEQHVPQELLLLKYVETQDRLEISEIAWHPARDAIIFTRARRRNFITTRYLSIKLEKRIVSFARSTLKTTFSAGGTPI